MAGPSPIKTKSEEPRWGENDTEAHACCATGTPTETKPNSAQPETWETALRGNQALPQFLPNEMIFANFLLERLDCRCTRIA